MKTRNNTVQWSEHLQKLKAKRRAKNKVAKQTRKKQRGK